jgi:magnesium transporter
MNIKIIHTKSLRWIDVINPGDAELKYLKENFKFSALDFQDITASSQHPKIEEQDEYNFLVLLFPVFNKSSREIRPGEVDFFIGPDYLVTIHDGSMYTMLKAVNNASAHAETRNQLMARNSGFLLFQLLELLFKRSFPILDYINKDMSAIEENIFDDLSLAMLEKISLMKRNIIDFRRIMKTHHLILKKLMAIKSSYMVFPENKPLYTRLLERAENIWDILAIQKETVEALQDANQSLATNNLNQITKVITIFSGLFLPATLVIFIFQMNVGGAPFRDNPYGFWIAILIAISASGFMLAYFKYKKWF